MVEFTKWIAIPIAIIGIALFFKFSQKYLSDLGFILIAIAFYIFFAAVSEIIITDAKLLYYKARSTPFGRDIMPPWNSLSAEDQHVEWWKNLCLLVFWHNGYRIGIALDSNIAKGNPIVSKYFNAGVVNLSVSDFRKIVSDQAYEVKEKMEGSKAVRWVEDHGGRISWKRDDKKSELNYEGRE